MKTLHFIIIIVLAAILAVISNNAFADNSTSNAYGGLVGQRVANFTSDHGSYPIWYKIVNGTVIGTPLDLPAKALIFMIDATNDGQLTVELPRSIIDSKNQSMDKPYFVAVGGVTSGLSMINASETSDNYLRILKINFAKNVSEIEIVGTFFVEKYPLHSGGVPLLQLSTPKDNFSDGEIISMNGHAPRNSTVSIFLVDNYGTIENSTQVKSNNTGYFNTSLGIPSHVVGGTWALFATSSENNFALQIMVNFHGSTPPPFNFPYGLTPLKQFKLGIKPSYVQCKTDLQVIIKSENGSPACVTPQTKIKLVDLGWAVDDSVRTRGVAPFDTLRVNVYGTIFSINYTISGGQLENATADVQNRSLIILIKTIENGALIVDLPRALIDPQINGQESQFIIIEDGKEVEYRQIDTTDKDRILTIPFQYGVSKIEIISPEPIR